MGSIQYIGTTDFTAQPTTGSFVQGQGWNKTVPYRGSTSKLNQFLTEIFVLGIQFGGINGIRWTQEGPYSIVEVTYAISPFDPAPSDPVSLTWTLVPQQVEISVWNHPKIQNGYTDSNGVSHLGLKDYDLATLATLRDQVNRVVSQGDNTITFESGSVGDVLSKLLARGEETLITPQYSLRKTQTVVATSQIVAAHANVGKMHDYAALAGAEPTLATAILIDPLNLQTTKQYGFNLVWLKMAPEVDQVAGGKYQIIQEYWGTLQFDDFLYDVVL